MKSRLKNEVEKIENKEMIIDEKYLKLYSERLLEQKKELEMHLYTMKHHSGRKSWLYQNFHALHPKTTITRMETYRNQLEQDIGQYKEFSKSVKTVSGMKKYMREQREMEEDIFSDLW